MEIYSRIMAHRIKAPEPKDPAEDSITDNPADTG